jgi:peptide/nickel transport system permease protein
MDFWNRFKRDRLAVIGAVVVVVFTIVSLVAPLIASYSPNEQFVDGLSLQGSPLPPSGKFWLGTCG